jgi:hypothetical protein
LLGAAFVLAVSPHARAAEPSARPTFDDRDIEVLEVIGETTNAAESAQLNLRKKAAVVSDNISAEAIKLSPDSDAAEIVQRIPAVTIKDGQYLNVRGLNERYTSALLNGSRLPSTDPERRVVPLDLFPADFIESLSLVKTYTPDLPGDFSGGLADIRLRRYPDALTASIGLSTSANTQTTFSSFNTYEGGGAADWFGYGDGFRSLPDVIPNRNIQAPPGAQAQVYGRSFRNIWEVDERTAPPNYGVNLSLGNSFGNFGAGLGVTYGVDHSSVADEERRRLVVVGQDPNGDALVRVADDFEYDTDTFETKLGALLSAGGRVGDDHAFGLRALYNRNSEDVVRLGTGTTESIGASRSTQFQYTVEQLLFGQLTGEHALPGAEIDWRTAYASTIQDQPDGRFQNYTDGDGDGRFEFVPDSFGGSRLFGELDEQLSDSAVDLTVPFTLPRLTWADRWSDAEAKLTIGPAYAYRERDHELRRFRYRATDVGRSRLDLSAPAEALLAPENIGPTGFTFLEETQPRDAFDATHEIIGGYGMIEFPLYPGRRGGTGLEHEVRLIGGVRTEYSYIVVHSIGQTGDPTTTILNDLDPLPGINLVYSPTEDMNVRLAWSEAVSRPEFRELSPVRYPSPQGLVATQGNPFLTSSSITSYDVRWEWFLTATDLLSASFFYKEIQDPIEQIAANEASNIIFTFVNGDSAAILGGELEARGNLGTMWSRLDPFDLTTNLTYVDSEVDIPDAGVSTNKKRELVGQAPYIVNVTLDYAYADWATFRLLYNTFGKRIIAAGANQLPDIFEQPRHQVDFVFLTEFAPFDETIKAKLAVENILNDRYGFEQGSFVWRQYESGVKFSLSFSHSF